MSSAAAVNIESLVMPDKVVAAHAVTETECSACHVAFARERQSSLCIDCHKDVGADQLAKRGFHGRHPEASSAKCASCHTDHLGRDANIVVFNPQDFNHSYSDFELLGEHAKAECDDCHEPKKLYRQAPAQCLACHKDDDVHEGGLGEDCASCHVARGWEILEFEHEIETGFALLGGHAEATCNACHIDNVYSDTESQCLACHKDDDVHEGGLGEDCASCHVALAWQTVEFEHQLETGFALLGGHAETTCNACHVNNVYVETESQCVACHRKDDVHKGLNGNDCADCHSETNWQDSYFDHQRMTDFALRGSHAALECEACHVSPVHERSPDATCNGCHFEDDPHEGQLGAECADCHNDDDWTTRVVFDHEFTEFPLFGAHSDAECAACHESSRFKDARVACIDCHRSDDFHEGGLGESCGDCHNPSDWSRWRFDHFVSTSFALDGAHSDLVCADCHKQPARPGESTSSRCIDCHRRDDVHNNQFGKDCARCHTTTTFRGAKQP